MASFLMTFDPLKPSVGAKVQALQGSGAKQTSSAFLSVGVHYYRLGSAGEQDMRPGLLEVAAGLSCSAAETRQVLALVASPVT